MIKVGLGQSENIDTRAAVESAILQCKQKLAGNQPQAGIVLSGVNFDHRLMLDEILQRFPGIELIGCTSAGEFTSSYGFSDDSISLMVFYSDDVEIKVGVGRQLSRNPQSAVKSAVKQAADKLSKRASICLAFPDGYNKSFEPIMKLFNQELGRDCPVFGGAAGILWNESARPLQFYNEAILEDAIPIMVFGGPLEYSFAIANSWQPIGKQAKVTEVDGRIVSRINDFKAVDFYRHYLGDHTEPAREFIMAVYDTDDEHFYVRAPIEYNPDGSITFSETIPLGATIQLTEAIRDVMIEDTRITTQKIGPAGTGSGTGFCDGILLCISQGYPGYAGWRRAPNIEGKSAAADTGDRIFFLWRNRPTGKRSGKFCPWGHPGHASGRPQQRTGGSIH